VLLSLPAAFGCGRYCPCDDVGGRALWELHVNIADIDDYVLQ
jgi:hypothetical protein